MFKILNIVRLQLAVCPLLYVTECHNVYVSYINMRHFHLTFWLLWGASLVYFLLINNTRYSYYQLVHWLMRVRKPWSVLNHCVPSTSSAPVFVWFLMCSGTETTTVLLRAVVKSGRWCIHGAWPCCKRDWRSQHRSSQNHFYPWVMCRILQRVHQLHFQLLYEVESGKSLK